MSRQPLPLVDSARTEFGFERTICSCAECTVNCEHMPGYLIPDDLVRIQNHLAPEDSLLTWAVRHLLASPGAKVMRRGRIFRIPTLVPARQDNGACHFLTSEKHCAIHAIAPFGCAFFDAHMTREQADERSCHGLQAILSAWLTGDLYAQVWQALAAVGQRASPPELCRQRIKEAWDQATRPPSYVSSITP